MKRSHLILLVFFFLVVCTVVKLFVLPKKPLRDFCDQIHIGMSRNEVEGMLCSFEQRPAYERGFRSTWNGPDDRWYEWYDDTNAIDIAWENGKVIEKELSSRAVQPETESWLDKLMRRINR